MNDVREKYLRILRAGLWDGPCAEEVTEEIFLTASAQATTGLICRNSAKREHREEIMRLMMIHLKTGAVLSEVISTLEANGINCVLLKGQGCASYYFQPMLRNCGDIDIFVGGENYSGACSILSSMAGAGSSCSESAKHMHTSFKGIPVEIHRIAENMPTPRTDRLFREWSLEGLTGDTVPVTMDGFTFRTPEDNFNAVYIFNHLFHHFIAAGIGFRQICDWTMFLHRKAGLLDTEKLGERLRALGMMEAWRTFGYIAVNSLGLDASEMPFYDGAVAAKADRLLEMIFRSGNFGRLRMAGRKRSGNYWIAKTGSLFRHSLYTLETVRLFPQLALVSYAGTVGKGLAQVASDISKGKVSQ
ncbi:MAG: nucleotidyltransferase family protein [Bacteroidales bacterium]|nr:nucleotidyltransferase family protein [Bacteroidales bacterium]